jgi:photosystem II stability/assembly factor-like uncharacterized protein
MVAFAVLFAGATFAAPPDIAWTPVGVGGGGALFSPSFSPHDSQRVYISCDMSELFESTNLGATWAPVDFAQVVGNRASEVQFTSDPNVQYVLDFAVEDGADLVRPKRSLDGGATWTYLANDPTGGGAFYLYADPTSTQRLVITDYSQLYFSNDGGTTWNLRYTAADGGAGIHIGGAFFDGSNIFLGINDGLLVSTNGGTSFAISSVPGLPGGRGMASFAAAKEGGTTRLWAVMTSSGLYGGIPMTDLFWPHNDLYTMDWGVTNWVEKDSGLPPGPGDDGNSVVFVRTSLNDIDVAWAGGQRDDEHPFIYRTTNGGTSWTSVLTTATNGNVTTGWAGHLGDRQWSYGAGTLGFAVSPVDSSVAAFTDLGFVHLTTNGGTSWSQRYVQQSDSNPAGSATPQGLSYASNGLEDTSVWKIAWLTPTVMWGCYSDIRGTRSTDGGMKWGFSYTGHTDNTSYAALVHPSTGVAYQGTGTRHDMYATTTLTDATIDSADGAIRFSTNQGATWQVLHDFNHTVYDLALDPNNTDRMYAAVIHAGNGVPANAEGGIWVTSNLSAGAASTWTRLTPPPRTEGHPYTIRVLNDGTLVASYSGRRAGGVFTQSSGVFVSTNGGTSWLDRSHANMTYYVKDIVIDPNDATQNTWYASVWSGYGGPLTTNNQAGGLYKTVNRGTSWTRVLDSHRVSSCTVDPTNADIMFVTTEAEGLWYTDNATSGTPTFARVMSFPFRQPERVYYDPAVADRIWVGSFGNGLRFGDITPVSAGVNSWTMY